MDTILRQYGYSVTDDTWFYLSLLLILAVYFRFNRVLSLRNLDLALLLSIAPGLLFVKHDYNVGYGWLFIVTGCLLVRLFSDSLWKRRPLLEQNLNSSGMAFLAVCVFVLLVSKALTEPPSREAVETVRRADEFRKRQDTTQEQPATDEASAGPTARVLAAPVVAASDLMVSSGSPERENRSEVEQSAARAIAVLAHLSVVLGLWFLGKRLFGDVNSGLAMVTLYLLLPCTAIDVGKVNHVLPAALVVWAFVAYRNPLISGSLLGLACGALLFPLFLLPLWAVFYGKQGAGRFVSALGAVAAVLIASLLLTSSDSHSFTKQILGSIDWSSLTLTLSNDATGIWGKDTGVYRIPVIVAFFVMLLILTFFPRHKNLEHLLGHSTAIVVATQLWYPQQGGAYVLWYLPLLLAVVFRPKLTSQTPPVIMPAPSEEQQLAVPARMLVNISWFRGRGS